MSDLGSSAAATPLPEPPPKRRKVVAHSTSATPRSSSPDELNDTTVTTIAAAAAKTSSTTRTKKRSSTSRRLSTNRGRPSMTPSRSPSEDELNEAAYYSRSSHSQSRSRSHSRSRSRSRTPRSATASPSRSRSDDDDDDDDDSRAGSRSPASTSAGSSPRSLSGAVDRRLRLSSTNGGADTGATVTTPVTPGPVKKGPVRPRYEEERVLSGHVGSPVSQVRISPDGRWIASASADGTVKTWDAATGEHMDTLVGHMAGVSCVAWSPNSESLATGSDDKSIRLWDRVTGRPKVTAKGVGHMAKDDAAPSARPMPPLRGHHNYVMCLAFSPRGNILASGSYDEAVFLWDVRAGRLMRSLPAHSDPVSGIDFCCDGTLVVSCSTDGLIRIWDTYTGQCLRTLVHEDNPAVTSVCFAPNGRFVLAFNLDNSIRLWDYVAGSVKKTYQGHANNRFAIGGCFGLVPGEGAFIASASEDGEIVLWDVVTKEVVQRIPAHKKDHRGGGKGASVCFWVDVHGDVMVSAGQDGRIRIFKRALGDGEVGTEAAATTTETNAADALMNGYATSKAGVEDNANVNGTEPPIKQEEDVDMAGV
ncbi:WD domain-containing protein [Colletotrichum orchidophilum]|uniref:Mitochondrial division protein 1 n=1 Tax=Colletotrichum orchidophilum TaxID=1209926 RepID=A0A1G4AV94_9PEZI|nr:WD domain-containing protein [Colletotrichum orchidophilum]OHE93031.1 WD domain-containing protein [Colletotrichum orchidophilum]